jgi:UDP-glucuronate 4-epimerase
LQVGAHTRSLSLISFFPYSLFPVAHVYHNLYGQLSTALGFFTLHGLWGRPDMPYYFFTEKNYEKKSSRFSTTVALSVTFTYIDDVVDGIVASLDI